MTDVQKSCSIDYKVFASRSLLQNSFVPIDVYVYMAFPRPSFAKDNRASSNHPLDLGHFNIALYYILTIPTLFYVVIFKNHTMTDFKVSFVCFFCFNCKIANHDLL